LDVLGAKNWCSINELVQELASSDLVGNISPEEIFLLRGQLEAAQRLVEASPIVTVASIKSVLLQPIKWLTDKITSGVIGAKAADIFQFLIKSSLGPQEYAKTY